MSLEDLLRDAVTNATEVPMPPPAKRYNPAHLQALVHTITTTPQPFVVHPAEWRCWEHYFETGVWDERLRLTFDQASMSWVMVRPLLWEGDNT